jgi:hypothetical protein
VKSIFAMAAGFACANAFAATGIAFLPANPTPADTIRISFTEPVATCPYFVPASTTHSGGTLRLQIRHIGDCGFGPYETTITTLGRLPAGEYAISISHTDPGVSPIPPAITATLTVSYPPGADTSAPTKPVEDYGGQYLTDVAGEGVFVEQYGTTAFITYAGYGADGKPMWLVMPDARYGFNNQRGTPEFTGNVYSAQRNGTVLAVTPIGSGVFWSAGTEVGWLTMNLPGAPLARTIRRFRFQ